MLSKSLSLLVVVAVLASAQAFSPVVTAGVRAATTPSSRTTALQAVVDIDSESAFDKTVKNAGNSLVIVDYSTTWCGPCKVIAPKFEELSEKYTDAVFLKVRDFTKRK